MERYVVSVDMCDMSSYMLSRTTKWLMLDASRPPPPRCLLTSLNSLAPKSCAGVRSVLARRVCLSGPGFSSRFGVVCLLFCFWWPVSTGDASPFSTAGSHTAMLRMHARCSMVGLESRQLARRLNATGRYGRFEGPS